MEVESESTTLPNWLDLPRDLTANILQRLGAFEILTGACGVCAMWWNICKDPLMWRSIHIRGYVPLFDRFIFGKFSHYGYDEEEMVKICCNAIERSCHHLEDIDIEGFGNDDILNCISNKYSVFLIIPKILFLNIYIFFWYNVLLFLSGIFLIVCLFKFYSGSHLRSMRFADCYEISDEGFSEVARKVPLLEKLDITGTKITAVSIAVLGRSCPLLKSLKLEFSGGLPDFWPCDDLALVIADTMTNLRHLDIDGDNLTNVGLLAILDKCPFLESLRLERCLYLKLSESLEKRCIDQINHLQLPCPHDADGNDFEEGYDILYPWSF